MKVLLTVQLKNDSGKLMSTYRVVEHDSGRCKLHVRCASDCGICRSHEEANGHKFGPDLTPSALRCYIREARRYIDKKDCKVGCTWFKGTTARKIKRFAKTFRGDV